MWRARAIAIAAATVLVTGAEPFPLRAQETAGFRPTDVYRLRVAGEPAVAPSGEMVAYTVRRPARDTDRVHGQLRVQALRDGRPDGAFVRVTDAGEDAHTPRWSPDGSVLSFVSRRGDDPNPIWFVASADPGSDPYHVEGVEGPPVWSPDGEWIAYVRAVLPTGDDTTTSVTRSPSEAPVGGRVVTDLPYRSLSGGGVLPPPEERPLRRLFVVPAEGGEPRMLSEPGYEVTEAAWTPDGGGLYFVTQPPGADPASTPPDRSLRYVSLDRERVHRVSGGTGGDWAPALSPDGERIAYLRMEGPGSQVEIRVSELGRSGGFSGDHVVVTKGVDADAGPPTWSPGGDSLYFLARDGGRRSLHRVDARGGSPSPVISGDREVKAVSFSRDGSVLAFTASSSTRPADLHVAGPEGSAEARVTALNRELVEERDVSHPISLDWRLDDSTRIEGWVVEPVGFRPGAPHGLVVVLRDGPHGAFGYDFEPLVHALSGAGYFVLVPNPRGSAGYGHAFRNAIRGRWGIPEKEDVVAGIDAALTRYPEIDPGRVGAVGEGYGGFLAAWLTATSDRFAAAVPVRAVTSWESWYGASAARATAERGLRGPPWRRRSLYRRVSPLSYVENVTAPTLLLHDRENARTPAFQSEQWFAALKRRGVPTELVLYSPEARLESGELGPRARVDVLARSVRWFDRWLGDGEAEGRVSEPGEGR